MLSAIKTQPTARPEAVGFSPKGDSNLVDIIAGQAACYSGLDHIDGFLVVTDVLAYVFAYAGV
ncbi:hypothetical protein ACFL2Q_19195 [Thermodesulfobacteriota bacterium]